LLLRKGNVVFFITFICNNLSIAVRIQMKFFLKLIKATWILVYIPVSVKNLLQLFYIRVTSFLSKNIKFCFLKIFNELRCLPAYHSRINYADKKMSHYRSKTNRRERQKRRRNKRGDHLCSFIRKCRRATTFSFFILLCRHNNFVMST
jgi:hypothetical protein